MSKKDKPAIEHIARFEVPYLFRKPRTQWHAASLLPALPSTKAARFLSALTLVLLSTFPTFSPQVALADNNCTAALYGTSDNVAGSSATSNQTAVEVGVKFTP